MFHLYIYIMYIDRKNYLKCVFMYVYLYLRECSIHLSDYKANAVLTNFILSVKRKSTEENSKKRKFILTRGPVEPQEHFVVPFEKLASYNKLFNAIQSRQCPFFVGHYQSGKISTLRYLSNQND